MKKVLIIGGSTDIGISLAKYLIKKDYEVLLTYNKNKIIDEDFTTIKCDVTSESSIEDTIKYAINLFGNIDILINMAAISLDNSFLNKTKEEFLSVLTVNLVGTFLTNQIYSRYIDNGLIINVSSTDGIDTFSKYNIDYSASKAGIINMTKSISMSTTNKVLCVCPNWIDSYTTNSMNKDYLLSELKRIKQDRLIKIDEFTRSMYEIINTNYDTGSIIRMDIKDGNLWLKKIS
ncbi:MAG: SDR family NAD(P)-dependent oxidoreductase [Bacilli bacterium]|nr:SDR family NAD(P)-dependent oxidoreductase [Bacilli bacterium]